MLITSSGHALLARGMIFELIPTAKMETRRPVEGLFMVALWNRADRYIFMLWFVLFFFFSSGRSVLAKIPGGRGRPWGIFFGFYKTRHILLSDSANCIVLRAVVLTQYRRVTDERTDGQTDGIAVASTCTALAMRALRRAVMIADSTIAQTHRYTTQKKQHQPETCITIYD